jgi:RNA polymerase sigma factor for flagellar operon FliA
MRGGVAFECTSLEEMLCFLRGERPANALTPDAPAKRVEPSALFEEHQELARCLACVARRRFPTVALADLRAFALEGLWEASTRFDETRGVPFPAFARCRILGQIGDEIRAANMLSRRARSAGCEMSEFDDEQLTADEELTVDEQLHELRMVLAVREKTEALSDRARALILGHYVDDRRFDLVAADLGISKSWASRIHTKAVGRLRRSLKAARVAL